MTKHRFTIMLIAAFLSSSLVSCNNDTNKSGEKEVVIVDTEMLMSKSEWEKDSIKQAQLLKEQAQIIDSLKIQLTEKNKKQEFANSAAPLSMPVFENILLTVERLTRKHNYPKPVSSKLIKNIFEEAFAENGYNYAATLHKVAINSFSMTEITSAQILVLPAMYGESFNPEAYSGQELIDVKKVFKMIEQL